MSYIVIQRRIVDLPTYSEFDDLDTASMYLEHFCNEGGSTEAKLYRLEPIDFEVRKVFRVEIPSSVADRNPTSPLTNLGSLEPDLAELDRQLSAEPRRGLFGR